VLDDTHDLNYREWTIPKNTPIAMSIPGIHLDGTIFRDPYNFDPARFLGEEGKLANKYYMPFHRGYRSCLGMK
jgi:cytochrome P450